MVCDEVWTEPRQYGKVALGDIYAGVVRVGGAWAYNGYVHLVAGLDSAERFTWEDKPGEYLLDSKGWYLGYDGPSGCLKEHYKGLSSYWNLVRTASDATWRLADTNPGKSRIVSWNPNQEWPLMGDRYVLQELDPGNEYALSVELVPSSAPKSM